MSTILLPFIQTQAYKAFEIKLIINIKFFQMAYVAIFRLIADKNDTDC